MIVGDLVAVLDGVAPVHLAESWDNVGLLVGDPAAPVSRVLLCIDYTEAVAAEGAARGCDAVVAYHPPIFQPLKRIVAGSVVADALRRGIAVYSPHTAFDVAVGGTNDVLADALGLTDRVPLRPAPAPSDGVKLVTFVPAEAVERVSDALFAAGAGQIGSYASCSFRTAGTGTFWGQSESRPVRGQPGRFEQVDEIRLEMVVADAAVGAVVRALRDAHPYEEPAFDLLGRTSPPVAYGLGRVGTLPNVPRAELFARIKDALAINHLLIAGPMAGTVRRAAAGAGACGSLIDDALTANADLYLTGELRHHDALRAVQAGMTVVCTLHSNSERAALKRLQQRIVEQLSTLDVCLSDVDRDPFVVA